MTSELALGLAAWVATTCGALQVDVAELGVDPARFGDGGEVRWEGDPCRSHPTLRLVWSHEGDVDALTVRPVLEIRVAAPVAGRAAAVGEPLEVVLGPVLLGTAPAFVGETALATRAVGAGEPLTVSNAMAPIDRTSGEAVALRVRIGALEVRADGRLLEDGRIGETVRVYNRATDTVVRGVLVSNDTVEL